MLLMRLIFRIFLVCAASIVVATAAPSTSPADAAFHKLSALVGNWEGKDDSGAEVKSHFQLIAGRTAVMETLTMPGMDQMVTFYSLDGDSILLVHYCPTNNQPRMRATPQSDAPLKLVFSFQSVANLPNPEAGHEHKLVLEFAGKDHIVEHWTWRQSNKDTVITYRLSRVPPHP
jgi:hypothetical protein